jgi:hypothetical protein
VNTPSPPVSSDQVSALDSSAQSTGGSQAVGQRVLPCQAWTLNVVVESTVPFYPDKSVSVGFKITAGGSGYQSQGTLMGATTSPPVVLKGGGTLTYSVSATADKWVSAGGASVPVSPNVDPFTATVKIKPTRPWAIIQVMDDTTSKLIPKFDVGLKLGTGAKKATTAADKPSIFQELMTEESDGQFTTSGNATQFGLASVVHADEVWEFVSIATT